MPVQPGITQVDHGDQNQNQNSLLVKRQNDNTSPVDAPVMSR